MVPVDEHRENERVSGAYAYDNAGREAPSRFDALSAGYDAGTIRHLTDLGVGPGWHCLEVGAGHGSIAHWLSERVGPSGRILATDIDTRHLSFLNLPNVEVLQHDIASDPLPERAFDLAHCRLVLVHLPQRDLALTRMVSALKPGGVLLAEEFDTLSMQADSTINPVEDPLKTHSALFTLLHRKGVDVRYGRVLPGRLRDSGLVNIHAEGRVFMWSGASPFADHHKANFDQLRRDMIEAGLITAEEFERDRARLDDPQFFRLSPVMWAVWGRRP